MGKKECSKRWYEKNKWRYLQYQRDQRKKIKTMIVDYKKTHPCKECGFKDYRALQFHHNNPVDKEFRIAEGAKRKYGKQRLLKEMEKCVVLCANCHQIKHYK